MVMTAGGFVLAWFINFITYVLLHTLGLFLLSKLSTNNLVQFIYDKIIFNGSASPTTTGGAVDMSRLREGFGRFGENINKYSSSAKDAIKNLGSKTLGDNLMNVLAQGGIFSLLVSLIIWHGTMTESFQDMEQTKEKVNRYISNARNYIKNMTV